LSFITLGAVRMVVFWRENLTQDTVASTVTSTTQRATPKRLGYLFRGTDEAAVAYKWPEVGM